MTIRIYTGLLLAFVSTFIPEGRVPLAAAVGAYCVVGEPMDLQNPVVSVVEGPGDPVQEGDWWQGLARAWVAGDVDIYLGEEDFGLEETP